MAGDRKDVQDPQIERFLHHLRVERRYSPHTVSSYRRELAKFAAHHQGDLSAVQTHDVTLYTGALRQQGLQAKSIQRALSALRSFYAYLQKKGEIVANPAAVARAPKAKRKLPEVLDTDQAAQLFTSEPSTPISLRDRAMLELFYGAGLRLAELVQLDVGDVDFANGHARVLGKGNKTRLAPLGRHCRSALTAWLAVHPDHRRDAPCSQAAANDASARARCKPG